MRIAQWLLLCWFPTLSLLAQATDPNTVLDQVDELRKEALFAKADSLLNTLPSGTSDSLDLAIRLTRLHLLIDRENTFNLADSFALIDQEVPTERYPLLAAKWANLQGLWHQENNQFEAALQAFLRTRDLRIAQMGNDHPLVANAYNNIGNLFYRLGQLDQAIAAHQRALTIRKQAFVPPDLTLASSYNNLAACYYGLGNFRASLDAYRQSFGMRKSLLDTDHPLIAASYNNIGNCFLGMQELDSALVYHRQALKLREQIGHITAIGQSHNNLGNVYAAFRNTKEALFHYRQALELRARHFGRQSVPVARALSNLGNYQLEQGDYGAAAGHLQEASLILDQLSIGGPFRADVQMNYGRVLLYTDAYGEAAVQLQGALAYYQQVLGSSHPRTIEALTLLGNLAANQEQYNIAVKYYQQVQSGLQQSPESDTLALIRNLNNQARMRLLLQQPEQGLKLLQQANDLLRQQKLREHPLSLTIVANQLRASRLSGQSTIGNDLLARGTPPTLLIESAPIEYLEWLYEAGRFVAANNQWERALKYYDEGASVLEQQVDRYVSADSRRQLVRWQYDLFDAAMDACYVLHEQQPDRRYAELAFQWNERSRTALFRDWSTPVQAGGELSELEANLTKLERQWYELQSKSLDSATTRDWQLRLLRAREDLRNARRSNTSATLNDSPMVAPAMMTELRQQLRAARQQLVAFYFGETHSYRLYIDGETTHFVRLADTLDATGLTIRLRDALTNFQRAQEAEYYRIYAGNYATAAHSLYTHLLGGLPAKTNRLVILPDGPLYYLPFDLLLTEPADSGQLLQFHRYPYAVRDVSFSYQHSATLWLQQKRQPVKHNGYWLGVAPSFSGNLPDLPPLRHNQEEVKAIQSGLYRTRTVLGDRADRDRFRQLAQRARILHLATHGQADPDQGLFSYLAFAEAGDSLSPKLYARELQTMRLPVELVVLSACQTGLGSYERGEGLVSLTRALQEAGARSTLTTLWSIDDAKSSALMRSFYRYLRQGLPKDQALQQARLDYLDENRGEFAHPFFWAAYIPQGDMRSLKLYPGWYSWLMWGGIGLAILLFIWIFLPLRHKFTKMH